MARNFVCVCNRQDARRALNTKKGWRKPQTLHMEFSSCLLVCCLQCVPFDAQITRNLKLLSSIPFPACPFTQTHIFYLFGTWEEFCIKLEEQRVKEITTICAFLEAED